MELDLGVLIQRPITTRDWGEPSFKAFSYRLAVDWNASRPDGAVQFVIFFSLAKEK